MYVFMHRWLCSWYLCVHSYFEGCKRFGPGHMPVAKVLFGETVQNGKKDEVVSSVCKCWCVCFFYVIQRHIYMPIAMQVDYAKMSMYCVNVTVHLYSAV